MRLDALLDGLGATIHGDGSAEIRRITDDSRRAGPGSLFVARRGRATDGHRFLADAAARGAAALLCARPPAAGLGLPVALAADPYRVAVAAAHRLAGDPSRRLRLVGVTGTNGKSTTAFLIRHLIHRFGGDAGLVGTLEYRVGRHRLPAPNTTPGALRLVELLGRMAEAGQDHAVMEVSSHGLDQERVAGCRFQAVVFTNLTQDHLDYHGDMERYFEAKARLFAPPVASPETVAVVNLDDPYGRRLAAATPLRRLTYGLAPGAAVRAEGVACSAAGSRFTLVHGRRRVAAEIRLLGRVNVENALAAAAYGLACGHPLEAVAEALATAPPVPGRYEPVGPGRPAVLVDYAHTPDALARAVADCRRLTSGRLLLVFGCGGDRDRGKRPLMGRAAAAADRVFLTSDNPRTEPPAAIAAEVEPGLAGCDYRVELDREAAIHRAIAEAGEADLVLIAGKGHEDYQIVGEERRPFDDRSVAAAALAARAAGVAG